MARRSFRETFGRFAAGFVAASIVAMCALQTTAARAQDDIMAACKSVDFERSVPACSQILESKPTTSVAEEAYQNRAFRFMAKGDFEKAVADWTEASRIRPDFPGVLTERANSYTRLNKFDLATADFDAALRLKPDFARAYAGRSTMDFLMGDMAKTIADASEAIRIDPKMFSAYSNRGSARRERGDLDGAVTDLNIAIRLSPYTSRSLYQRGLTYFRKGDFQPALADYEAAVAINANEHDAVVGRDVVKAALAARNRNSSAIPVSPTPGPVPAVQSPPPVPPAPAEQQASSDQKTPPTRNVPPPTSPVAPSDIASRIWSVELHRSSDGSLYCEALARGRTPEAGGDYTISLRIYARSNTFLILTYAKPRFAKTVSAEVFVDTDQVAELKFASARTGNENQLIAAGDEASFDALLLKKFENPAVQSFELRVEGRIFGIPVQGFSIVRAGLNACKQRL